MNRNLKALFGIVIIFMFLVPVAASAMPQEEHMTNNPIKGKPGSSPLMCVIVAPTNGATVSGIVTIIVEASGTPTITIDGGSIGKFFTIEWDSTSVADGSHTIEASYRKAKDTITVTVDNGVSPPPPPPPPGGDGVVKKYAVLVGINEYIGISGLDNCVNDVIDWTAYLQGKGYSITTLIDSQATEFAVKNALNSMIAKADADDQIIFMQSSHGYKIARSQMLCMYDTSPDGLYGEDGDLYDTELADIFSVAVAKAFIFFDVCYSGGMNEAVDINPNIYMTTTCGPSGYGYDVAEYQNGAWTYWFLEQGLVGQSIPEAQAAFDWAAPQFPYSGGSAPCEFGTILFVF